MQKEKNMIIFNFYGFIVKITSKNKELINLIEKNFSLFISDEKRIKFSIDVIEQQHLDGIIPEGLVSIKQSLNSITFEMKGLRYNNYYDRAVTVIDYKSNEAKVYAKDLNDLHEITYLMIMSRQGKWCDQRGLHKIHAMAVSDSKKNLILMLPMRGGKSTLFTKFLERTSLSLVSDDSPVINSRGVLYNFPIRFGLEDKPQYRSLISTIKKEYIFSLEREQFGKKILIDFKAFQNRVRTPPSKNILIQGFRKNNNSCSLKRISRLRMFKYVFINMTIGLGLPMVIEYFIENNLRDHIRNLVIFLKRLKATLCLLMKSECYISYMGYDSDINYTKLRSLLKG
jgi:hypothetical protein